MPPFHVPSNGRLNSSSNEAECRPFVAICLQICVFPASNGQRNMKRASNCCIVSKHSLLKGLSGGARLFCIVRLQYRWLPAVRLVHIHWSTQCEQLYSEDSQNITDGKLTSLSSFVLFFVQKGASFINDQPTWRKTSRITQPHFSCLMRRLHVCLLSINYSGFTALESPGQTLGLHFGLIRGHRNRSGMSSRLW